MTDDTLTSVDTITIAALLRALQVVITAYAQRADPTAVQALEQATIAEIKALDTGEFTYEEQAEGLAEGMLYARAMFRYALANPAPALPAAIEANAPEVPVDQAQLHVYRN